MYNMAFVGPDAFVGSHVYRTVCANGKLICKM